MYTVKDDLSDIIIIHLVNMCSQSYDLSDIIIIHLVNMYDCQSYDLSDIIIIIPSSQHVYCQSYQSS